jgi:hypothetical protein
LGKKKNKVAAATPTKPNCFTRKRQARFSLWLVEQHDAECDQRGTMTIRTASNVMKKV